MKTLIAIDDTEESKQAVGFARELLDDDDETLVLNVVLPADSYPSGEAAQLAAGAHLPVGGRPPGEVPYPYPADNERARRLSNVARGQAQQRMHSVAEPLDPKRVLVRFGNPWRQICRTAEALDVDLVVLGTRDPGPLRRLLTGSVSRKVVDRAPCPVLVVRPGRDL